MLAQALFVLYTKGGAAEGLEGAGELLLQGAESTGRLLALERVALALETMLEGPFLVVPLACKLLHLAI